MAVEIKGFIPTSMLDWEGMIVSTLFLPDCNFRCPYCQNPDLILKPREIPTYDLEEIGEFLKEKEGWIEGVCVTGGEPCMRAGLAELLLWFKERGLGVKLDTNGSFPDRLSDLIKRGLVDFVAMDIKAPPDTYDELSGSSVDISAIEASIATIARLAPRYEFRTTVAPGLSQDDLIRIGDWIESGQGYWLQEFQVPVDKALVDEGYRNKTALKRDDLEAVWDRLRDRFDSGGVRG